MVADGRAALHQARVHSAVLADGVVTVVVTFDAAFGGSDFFVVGAVEQGVCLSGGKGIVIALRRLPLVSLRTLSYVTRSCFRPPTGTLLHLK